jgi:homoaconitase
LRAAILTSFNRNFKSRNDGNSKTMNFLASPTIVTAMAFSGKLSFNPQTDTLILPSGENFKFTPPVGQDLPQEGFTQGNLTYYPAPNPKPRPEAQIVIKKDSQRLELLEPFSNHFVDYSGNSVRTELPALKVLARIRGKCTTDHISAAVSLSLLSNSQKLYAHTVDRALGSSTKAISRIYPKTYVIAYLSLVRGSQSNFFLVICFK